MQIAEDDKPLCNASHAQRWNLACWQ